jgi:hypothetical protein
MQFLQSIRMRNLLSFGPEGAELELRVNRSTSPVGSARFPFAFRVIHDLLIILV